MNEKLIKIFLISVILFSVVFKISKNKNNNNYNQDQDKINPNENINYINNAKIYNNSIYIDQDNMHIKNYSDNFNHFQFEKHYLEVKNDIYSFFFSSSDSINYYKNNNEHVNKRVLITKEQFKNEICPDYVKKPPNQILKLDENGTIDEKNKYVEGFDDTLQYYIDSYEKITDENKLYLREAIFHMGLNGTKGEVLYKLYMPFLIMGVLAGLTFCGWILYFFCMCIPCCCCNSKFEPEPMLGLRNLFFAVQVCGVIGVIVIAILGYDYTNKFIPIFNNTSCAMLEFFMDTKYGENLKFMDSKDPKWSGYLDSDVRIDKMYSSYSNIEKYYKNVLTDQQCISD